jgi:3-deoxy-7-phosphoheptulonate synthase
MWIGKSRGNEDCHIILRGKAPHCSVAEDGAACKALLEAGLLEQAMTDVSHGNCSRQYRRQVEVARDVAA